MSRKPLHRLLTRLLALSIAIALTLGASFDAVAADPPALPSPATGAPAPTAVPAGRAARNIAVIPISGEIDKYTANSVHRRMDAAVRAGANAIVFDIDTPGGDMMATLQICAQIKSSKVANTVAWINPNAYSGGAIIALACKEIVVSDAATVGDALPIMVDQLHQLQQLPDAEREKMLGPLVADVVDSARRNGYDELLVQGLVRRGVELWLVEHAQTGQRLFVSERQYTVAVGDKPDRTASPIVPSVTGGGGGDRAKAPRGKHEPAPTPGPLPPISPDNVAPSVGPDPASPTMFIPAAPGMSKDLIEEINDALALVNSRSTRPDLKSAGHAGKYRPIEYVSDGHGLIVLKAPELLRYGLAQKAVNSDDELKAYFGAQSLQRLRVTWSEGLVRFLTNPFVRGFLIVVFLVALFAEMSHPGATVPGIIAAVALISLIVPPALVDMASWWEILAILSGLILLGIEVFVLPGFGVCGALGLILLFGGLIGTFVNQGSGLFPNTPQQTRDLTWGVSTVLVAFMVSGVALVFLWRSLPNLPLFGRLIHQDATGKEHEGLLEAMMSGPSPVKVGDQGVSLSPLRPSGRAQFGDQIVDAHADSGMIDPGAQIKVIRVEGLRIVVEQA